MGVVASEGGERTTTALRAGYSIVGKVGGEGLSFAWDSIASGCL